MPEKYVVIMAGGRGERFWPQSRLKCPKHLLPIVGDEPMLTQTIDRLDGLVPADRIFVITNAEQRDAMLKACPALIPGNVVGEPVGRDTAAAVGLAKVLVKSRDPDAVFAMLPADAAINDAAGFRRALKAASAAAAAEPCLVTIGIEPSYPATGYGYLQKGEEWESFEGLRACRVARFVEKPDSSTAASYLESGAYLWNAGMFVFSVSTIDACFHEFAPDLAEGLESIERKLAGGIGLDSALAEVYPNLRKISVDYAIMEPASASNRIVCVPSCFDWDDVGEWPAIARHCPADAEGNVIRGAAVTEGASNNIVVTAPGHTIALLGVEGLIVVQTADATLICPKDQAQGIKALVRKLGNDAAYSHLV